MAGQGKSKKSVTVAVAAKCSGCDEPPTDAPLRRGRCEKCYERWVRAKPVGTGALCVGCGERRRAVLRQFELARMWVVVCHNCAARAQTVTPRPRSVEGLRVKLSRDRRWGDRRADAVRETNKPRKGNERRDNDRRMSERSAVDVTDLAEMELEIEADFAEPHEGRDPADVDVTGIHLRVDAGDL